MANYDPEHSEAPKGTDFAGNLANYVYVQLREGKKPQDIRNDLIDRGYTPAYAEHLIGEAQRLYPQIKALEERTGASQIRRERERRERGRKFLIGFGIAFGVVLLASNYFL